MFQSFLISVFRPTSRLGTVSNRSHVLRVFDFPKVLFLVLITLMCLRFCLFLKAVSDIIERFSSSFLFGNVFNFKFTFNICFSKFLYKYNFFIFVNASATILLSFSFEGVSCLSSNLKLVLLLLVWFDDNTSNQNKCSNNATP